MTSEEKDLLLIDLCARLPYSVKCYIEFEDSKVFPERTLMPVMIQDFKEHEFVIFKPYLRPMSNMSEDEKIEWDAEYTYNSKSYEYEEYLSKMIDWLNARHFDYRGLIGKGLAIEVTEENNPYK